MIMTSLYTDMTGPILFAFWSLSAFLEPWKRTSFKFSIWF